VSYTLNSVPGPNVALDAKAAVTVDLVTAPGNVIVLDAQGVGPPGPKGEPGAGMIPGGTTGQALVKASAADYDTAWADAVAPAAHAATHAAGGTDPLTGPIALGTNPAQSGVIRIPNNQAITARNAAGTADVRALTVSANNDLILGAAAGRKIRLQLDVGGTPVEVGLIDQNIALFTGFLQVGTNAAAAGAIRIPNATEIRSRNAANTGDIHLLRCETDDSITLGGTVTGIKVGAAGQKLSFYGVPLVVRPTATPAAATDPATTMALVNDLRAKLITLGLIA